MNKDDADTYYRDDFAFHNGVNIFSKGIGQVHKAGLEIDCNL